jgi:hypothetical protein
MFSPMQLDYQQETSDPAYRAHMKARDEADKADIDRHAATLAAANAAAASSYKGQTTADIKAANALIREQIRQQINSFACPDCKRFATMTEDINTRCTKHKMQKPQGGSKIKSKSQRRKKSKSQRRRKSIKRRH